MKRGSWKESYTKVYSTPVYKVDIGKSPNVGPSISPVWAQVFNQNGPVFSANMGPSLQRKWARVSHQNGPGCHRKSTPGLPLNRTSNLQLKWAKDRHALNQILNQSIRIHYTYNTLVYRYLLFYSFLFVCKLLRRRLVNEWLIGICWH